MRELWGYYWIFAHNGNILNFSPTLTVLLFPLAILTVKKFFVGLCKSCEKRHGDHLPQKKIF